MIVSEEAMRLTRILWNQAGYTPTRGTWEIRDIDGELRTVSHGQAEIHECPNRLIQASGGVRAGKSKFLGMELLKYVWIENGLIWIVGPDYEQAKAEWNYMFEPLHAAGYIEDFSNPDRGGRHFTTPWGCKVQTKSSAELATLASFAPHALAGVEMGQQSYGAYEKLLERALEHDATVIMTGTLENAQTWYADLWEKWQGHNPEGGKSFSLPTWSNSKVFPGGRTDPKIKNLENGIPPELFLERVAAVPYKPSGLVFKLFDRKRHVGDYSFNEKLPIELAIDPAQHTYAIEAMQWETRKVKDWFEHLELAGAGKRTKEELAKELTMVYVVDEIYEHDMIAQDIISVVKERPWYPFVKTGVIDIAGTYKTATKSQQQVWAEETGIRLRGKLISIPEGIDVVKLRLRNDPILGVPLLYFDYRLRADKDYAGRANGIVAEAGLYRWPDWKAGMSSAARPVDANNDGWKAVGYWCYDRFGPVVERKKMRRGVVRDYF